MIINRRATISILIIVSLLACISGCVCGAPATEEKPSVTPTIKPTTTVSQDYVTAKEWYPLAENNATKWQSDAVLYSVYGSNLKKFGSSTPGQNRTIDGKSYYWTYEFVSSGSGKQYTVAVESGEIVHVTEMSLGNNERYLAVFKDRYPVSEWKYDSDDIIDIAINAYKQKYGREPGEIFTAYSLMNTKEQPENTNVMKWLVTFNGKADIPSEYQYTVVIDAITGNLR